MGKLLSLPSAASESNPPTGPSRWIGATLAGADLSGKDLRGVDLSEADLTDANLVGADLRGATLFRANLTGAELMGARLDGANLEGCVAHRAGLGGCSLAGASLFEADLSDATLTNSKLHDADLRACVLDRARLVGADLSRADLGGASMRGAHLEDAVVTEACFDRCDIRLATLRGVSGYESASFLRADFREVDFTGAYLMRRFVLDQNYLEELRTRDRYHAAVYWLWWATSDCGRSVGRWSLWIIAMTVGFGVAYQFVDMDYGGPSTWLAPYYFSTVTLTTLGYGDVLPVSGAGRALAMIEVLIGYVMLGGLLSIFANKMARRAD